MYFAARSFPFLSPPRVKAAVVGVFATVAGFYLLLPILIGLAAGGLRRAMWSYNGASIALSYFDTGFARRELEGTLIRLFTAEPMAGGLVFHLAACCAFAVLAFTATLKAALPDRNRLAIGAVLLAVLTIVVLDIGRADPAILTCGFVAAWGARTGRWMVAAAALSIALAFHETGFIVLAPMIACIAWEHRSWRSGRAASRVLGVLIVAGGVIGYLVALRLHPDVQAIGRKIHAEFADPRMADLSVYYTLSGTRGLASMLCQQRLDGEYLCKAAKGAGLIVVLSFALRPRRWLTTSIVVLAPFLFLSAIAVDIARWAVFGAFAIAAMALADAARKGEEPAPVIPVGNLVLALVAAALFAYRIPMINLGDPLPVIPNFLFGSGGIITDPMAAATRCDPGWKQFIGLAT